MGSNVAVLFGIPRDRAPLNHKEKCFVCSEENLHRILAEISAVLQQIKTTEVYLLQLEARK